MNIIKGLRKILLAFTIFSLITLLLAFSVENDVKALFCITLSAMYIGYSAITYTLYITLKEIEKMKKSLNTT